MNDLITYTGGMPVLSADVSRKISEFEATIKRAKEKEEQLKDAILVEMEQKRIIKLDCDDLTITYVAASDRETFDSKNFRKSHPDLYDEYVRITTVKPSVRIKVKSL